MNNAPQEVFAPLVAKHSNLDLVSVAESPANRKLARNGLGGDHGDLREADFWFASSKVYSGFKLWIEATKIALYTVLSGYQRERPEAGKTSTFIISIFPAVSYRRRLQSRHFRVTEICAVMDRQSSQGLKL
jgi:hypothetical protein